MVHYDYKVGGPTNNFVRPTLYLVELGFDKIGGQGLSREGHSFVYLQSINLHSLCFQLFCDNLNLAQVIFIYNCYALF